MYVRHGTKNAPDFRERRLGEVRSAPVRWAGISLVVVVPLRVATPCYTMEQRTLPGRGVRTPKRRRYAALEVLEPVRPVACYAELPRILLLRTRVNKG